MTRLLILRPDPGATQTARRAEELGLEAVIVPIFTIKALAWDPPAPDSVGSVMLTSANAARCAGKALEVFRRLRCYAVGETTAETARDAGFADIRIGPADGVKLVEMMAEEGVRSTLHLCGRDHIALDHPRLSIVRRIVYASEKVAPLPAAAGDALREGVLALLHSPRAAEHFAALVDEAGLERGSIAIAAISEAAAIAAGGGWKKVTAAKAPRDAALLELAAKLCKTEHPVAG
jgi:uroporphyrinogen-III synthase